MSLEAQVALYAAGMELLPLAFTSGWTSGINAYGTVVLLGLLGRFAGIEEVPAGLQRTDVLIIAAVLMVVEFAADKIAYVDSAWDTVSTVVRPVAGAVIGALLAGSNGDLVTLAPASVGGVTALLSHLVKASLRLAINTSPEPASNIVVSTAEDLTVAGVISLSVVQPWIAATLAACLLVIGAVLVLVALSRIRAVRARRRDRRLRAPT